MSKILALTYNAKYSPNDASQNFPSIYCHFLTTFLEKNNMEYDLCEPWNIPSDIKDYNYIISAWWGLLLNIKNIELIKKTNIKIILITERHSPEVCKISDYQIAFNYPEKYYPNNNHFIKTGNNYSVYWGCSPENLGINREETINILIDHYCMGQDAMRDKTETIIRRLVEYKNNTNKKIKLMLYDNSFYGKSEYTGGDDVEKIPSISFTDNCKLHSKVDVFVLTHKESFGLDICLSALCGSLILTDTEHSYCVSRKPDITFKEIDFGNVTNQEIDHIIDSIDRRRNLSIAKHHTFDNTIGKCLLDIFGESK